MHLGHITLLTAASILSCALWKYFEQFNRPWISLAGLGHGVGAIAWMAACAGLAQEVSADIFMILWAATLATGAHIGQRAHEKGVGIQNA